MPVVEKKDFIDWDAGREGYQQQPARYAAGAPAAKSAATIEAEKTLASIRLEERLGSIVAAAGTIWIVYVATHDYTNLWRLQFSPPGPLETAALGIVIWLHAKWRRSMKRV
ncbi:MAG TPA: hypothetical protein VE866_03930 [Candidatus Binatia bacterium]|nr:hypothetical protein [Candidatus Binatia bacterium]